MLRKKLANDILVLCVSTSQEKSIFTALRTILSLAASTVKSRIDRPCWKDFVQIQNPI